MYTRRMLVSIIIICWWRQAMVNENADGRENNSIANDAIAGEERALDVWLLTFARKIVSWHALARCSPSISLCMCAGHSHSEYGYNYICTFVHSNICTWISLKQIKLNVKDIRTDFVQIEVNRWRAAASVAVAVCLKIRNGVRLVRIMRVCESQTKTKNVKMDAQRIPTVRFTI